MRRADLWVGCIITFDIRESCAIKEYYELLWYLDTYDFARGFALSGHSSLSSSCRWSSPEEGFSPSWTLRPPQRGRPSFSSLLPLEGERSLLPPPRLHGRNAPWSRRMMNPTPPGAGHFFESPWPSSWPSSPAPHKVPEPAASPSGHRLGLRAKEPDSQSVRTSPAKPVKGKGA